MDIQEIKMVNEKQLQIINLLSEAFNKYIELDVQHPNDQMEFCNAIHRCQHLIMIRDVRRNDPKNFPIYKK